MDDWKKQTETNEWAMFAVEETGAENSQTEGLRNVYTGNISMWKTDKH